MERVCVACGGSGLTMERVCVACGGSGLAEHVDRTLPPPPCRLCHPEEAALHIIDPSEIEPGTDDYGV